MSRCSCQTDPLPTTRYARHSERSARYRHVLRQPPESANPQTDARVPACARVSVAVNTLADAVDGGEQRACCQRAADVKAALATALAALDAVAADLRRAGTANSKLLATVSASLRRLGTPNTTSSTNCPTSRVASMSAVPFGFAPSRLRIHGETRDQLGSSDGRSPRV